MAIRAVIFDVGGVLVRDSEPAPRHRAWERRLGLERGTLGDALFGTPVGARAMVGQASLQEIWRDFGQRYGLKPAELDALAKEFWLDSVWDVELLDYARSLRPRFKTGVISDAWLETRQAIADHVGPDKVTGEIASRSGGTDGHDVHAVADLVANLLQAATYRLDRSPFGHQVSPGDNTMCPVYQDEIG